MKQYSPSPTQFTQYFCRIRVIANHRATQLQIPSLHQISRILISVLLVVIFITSVVEYSTL